jgi:hypothetical protein
MECPEHPALRIASEITVACWMKAASSRWRDTVVCGGENAWRLGRHLGSGQLEFECAGVTVLGTNTRSVKGKTHVDDDRWHHAAGVYDGTSLRLYVDGVLDASSDASGTIRNTGSRVFIGSDDVERTRLGRNRAFHGLIDDVRIYDHALSEDTIQALCAGGSPSTGEP